MKNIKTTLLSTALLAVVAAPAFAAEGKKTKEIKELVGYNVTESVAYENSKMAAFNRIDTNDDSQLSFKEYRDGSNIDEAYSIFLRMDRDSSKSISIDEFASFNKTKGNTQIESEMHGKVSVKGTNLKSRALPETKTYFEAVEPTIVEIKNIEPAAE